MVKKIIATHDGGFHADDVFAVAALLLHLSKDGDATVVRSRDKAVIASADFVVDVGGEYAPERNRFDHHEPKGAGVRENGIPYAAFGLVWKKFGPELSGSREAAESLDALLCAPFDARDNGIEVVTPCVKGLTPYGVADAIRAFLPTWEEKVDIDERFMLVARTAEELLRREIARTHARIASEAFVISAYENSADKRLVVLDGDYSWKEIVARYPEPLFVIHPEEGHWRLYAVRDDPARFVNRKNLPAAWAGLRDRELAEATGVPDAVFCHRNRFMAVTRSREGALALARLALS